MYSNSNNYHLRPHSLERRSTRPSYATNKRRLFKVQERSYYLLPSRTSCTLSLYPATSTRSTSTFTSSTIRPLGRRRCLLWLMIRTMRMTVRCLPLRLFPRRQCLHPRLALPCAASYDLTPSWLLVELFRRVWCAPVFTWLSGPFLCPLSLSLLCLSLLPLLPLLPALPSSALATLPRACGHRQGDVCGHRHSFPSPRPVVNCSFQSTHTYYGEGPFDAPSSDDKDDGYLDKETHEQGSLEYSEPDNGLRVGGRQVE